MEGDKNLPSHVSYWLTASSKNDCFFVLGSEEKQTERIGAVKIFLMGYSVPLRNMLEDSELAERGDMRVVDIEPGTFRIFLKCVYGGSDVIIPMLSFQESVDLLYVMEKYLVAEFIPRVVSHIMLILPLTFENIFIAISNPVCFLYKKLEDALLKILERDTDNIFSSPMFLQLDTTALQQIVKAKHLSTSEVRVWIAVVKWGKHAANSKNGEDVRNHILSHLKFIRFCTFPCTKFCETVIPTGILTCEEVNEICNYFGTGDAPDLEYICNNTNPRVESETKITFVHVVKDINNANEKYSVSKKYLFHNCCWYITVQSNDKIDLEVYMNCIGISSDTSWEVQVDCNLSLINQQSKGNLSKSLKTKFSNINSVWGFSSFYSWNNLINVSNGFLLDNTIIIMAQVKLNE
ncbi:ubiquitin protein ligase binding [Homalodisca vitripennis]|nr:ubiquitin protein ligase binding [Homalodisca vitripennis]